MARVFAEARTAQQAYAAATVETLMAFLAATNHRFAVTRFQHGSEGIVNTEQPALVEIVRTSTAPTGVALTLRHKREGHPDTIETTALDAITAEGTRGDLLDAGTLHPQANLNSAENFAQEIEVGSVGRLSFVLTFPQAQTVSGFVAIEE